MASALTFDYFGSRVTEDRPSDHWLFMGVRERIGDRFKKKKCGTLLYRYHIMKSIEKLYKQMKAGIETFPLQPHSTNFTTVQQMEQIWKNSTEWL